MQLLGHPSQGVPKGGSTHCADIPLQVGDNLIRIGRPRALEDPTDSLLHMVVCVAQEQIADLQDLLYGIGDLVWRSNGDKRDWCRPTDVDLLGCGPSADARIELRERIHKWIQDAVAELVALPPPYDARLEPLLNSIKVGEVDKVSAPLRPVGRKGKLWKAGLQVVSNQIHHLVDWLGAMLGEPVRDPDEFRSWMTVATDAELLFNRLIEFGSSHGNRVYRGQ